MSDPSIPVAAIIKKLLSLDTPVARRIFEIALLVVLVWFCSYVGEHSKGSPTVQFAVGLVGVFGGLLAFLMLFGLFITIMDSLPRPGGKKQ